MRRGFTLMELLLTVMIAGTIAGFAVPSFTKAVDKGKARDVVNNLYAIGAAQVVYKARYGSYYLPIAMISVNQINAVLGTSVVEQTGVHYWCARALSIAPPGACTGVLTGKWGYVVAPSGWEPACSSGGMGGRPCPSGVP